MIHPLSDVRTDDIGVGTQVWQYAVILAGARIGAGGNVNCHTFIENDVVLGDRVTVKSGVYLWDGFSAGDDVFIGPNVTFANDRFPRSRRPVAPLRTHVGRGASIGAAAVILPGVNIGAYALVAAGALVTGDVPDHALAVGSPARVRGYVDRDGNPLQRTGPGSYRATDGTVYRFPSPTA